ncbi:MAG TPA: hypothetical protein V6D05_00110 [Stenomitos sp.]
MSWLIPPQGATRKAAVLDTAAFVHGVGLLGSRREDAGVEARLGGVEPGFQVRNQLLDSD